MSESTLEVSPGSGAKLHMNSKTVGANTVLDEYTIPGEFPSASYVIGTSFVSTATANDHLLQIMAGSSLNVYIRLITIEQANNATTAAIGTFALYRVSTAGTGGSALTPALLDTTDSASGMTAMTLPSSKGTETTSLHRSTIVLRQAFLATATQPEEQIEWNYDRPRMKSLRIPAGTSNGIVIKNLNAIAGATVTITVWAVELSY